jgi:hypothetical protein
MPAKRRAPSLSPPLSPPFETCTIHRVHCDLSKGHEKHFTVAYFEDAPQLFAGDSKASALRGKRNIVDMSEFLESHSNIGIMFYRDYDCQAYHGVIEPHFRALETPSDPVIKSLLPYFYRLDGDGMPAQSHDDAIFVSSEGLQETLVELTGMSPSIFSELDDSRLARDLVTQMYHHREIRDSSAVEAALGARSFELAKFLVKFMEEKFCNEYEEADALFSEGSVTKLHLPKLFAAQDLLVTREQDQPCAYILEKSSLEPLHLSCWAWRFNGRFWKYRSIFSVEWPSVQDKVAITDLPIYPLKYATPDVQALLESYGHTFWLLRHGKYVSYTPPNIQKDGHNVRLNMPRSFIMN